MFKGKRSWCHFPAEEAEIGTTITCRQYVVGDIPVGKTLNFLPGDTLAGYSMGFGSESWRNHREVGSANIDANASTQNAQRAEWDHCHAHTPGTPDLPTSGLAVLEVSTKALADLLRKEEEGN